MKLPLASWLCILLLLIILLSNFFFLHPCIILNLVPSSFVFTSSLHWWFYQQFLKFLSCRFTTMRWPQPGCLSCNIADSTTWWIMRYRRHFESRSKLKGLFQLLCLLLLGIILSKILSFFSLICRTIPINLSLWFKNIHNLTSNSFFSVTFLTYTLN